MVFLELQLEPGIFLSLPGWPFKIRVFSAMSGALSSYKKCLRNLHEAWQGNTDASQGDVGD